MAVVAKFALWFQTGQEAIAIIVKRSQKPLHRLFCVLICRSCCRCCCWHRIRNHLGSIWISIQSVRCEFTGLLQSTKNYPSGQDYEICWNLSQHIEIHNYVDPCLTTTVQKSTFKVIFKLWKHWILTPATRRKQELIVSRSQWRLACFPEITKSKYYQNISHGIQISSKYDCSELVCLRHQIHTNLFLIMCSI